MLVERVGEPGESLSVVGDELRYLARVRRLAAGDSVEVGDASGRRALAEIERIDKKAAVLRSIRSLPDAPRAVPVHALAAVPKRRLFDDAVRRIGELGAERLTPLLTGRTVALPGEDRVSRWRRIAAESLRQCGRATPLRVDSPTETDEALRSADRDRLRLILHTDPGLPSLMEELRRADPSLGVAVATGPEGGFEPEEVFRAEELGFVAVRLGPTVLRAETAAVAATALAVAFAGGFE
ncbi:MAG: 16S rRNA (uracil(1498)-N(3))-methyltransferase [Polyangia bacterium]